MVAIPTHDLRERATKLRTQAKDILVKPDFSAEDHEQVEKMMKDADSLDQRYSQLVDIDSKIVDVEGFDPKAVQAQQQVNGAVQKQTHGFNDLGEWMVKALNARNGISAPDERLQVFNDSQDRSMSTKDMATTTGASGGFTVPPGFLNDLMSIPAENEIVRSRATVLPMSTKSLTIPTLDQTGTSSSYSNFYGGLYAAWGDEGDAQTPRDAAFRQVELNAKKLRIGTRLTDELQMDNAVSLMAWLTGPMGLRGAVAHFEDYAFLQGTGGNQPLGILNSPCTVSIADRDNNNQVSYGDLIDMIVKLLPSSQSSAIWIASQTVMQQLLTLSGPAGNPGYLWTGGTTLGDQAVNKMPGALFGRPVIFTEKLPALGTAGDIMLVDLRYYLIGDRQAMSLDTSIHEKFLEDKTTLKVVHRVDGRPWLSSAITYMDGSTTVSPFVTLPA